MRASEIPAFAEQFDAVARERLTADDLVPELRVDVDMTLEGVGDELEKLVRHFEPFGIGNPAPVFRSRALHLAKAPRRIGTDGVRLTFNLPRGTVEGIGWGLAERASAIELAQPLDVAFRLERDEYRGVSRLQLKIADFQF